MRGMELDGAIIGSAREANSAIENHGVMIWKPFFLRTHLVNNADILCTHADSGVNQYAKRLLGADMIDAYGGRDNKG